MKTLLILWFSIWKKRGVKMKKKNDKNVHRIEEIKERLRNKEDSVEKRKKNRKEREKYMLQVEKEIWEKICWEKGWR